MSKNSYSRVGGENVRLLQALIDEAPSYTKPTNSRNANILKSIINNTEYNEPPQSEIEELLIALKAKIGGEIEVNELTVTENGSYDAGLNKAYNPVNVELPLDSKEITANGTYNASDDNLAGFSQVTVNVEGYKLKDIPNTQTAIATFSDGSDLPMPKLEVGIEAVQDLHGYDHPWVGGSGKNKCPINESTITGATYIVDTDINIASGTWTFSFESAVTTNCSLQITDADGNTLASVGISNPSRSATVTINAVGKHLKFYGYAGTYKKIQLEEGSTATTYEPYSNICPISGWDEVNVTRCGKNLCGELEIGTFTESSQIGSTYDEMKTANSARIRSKWLIPTFNNNIVISCDFTNYQFCFCLYDANKKYLGQIDGFGSWRSTPYTPVTPSSYVAIALKRNDGEIITSADLENCHLQVELGTIATTYEPYNGHTYTIDLNGTRYGGKVDLVSGVLTVDRVGVDLGTVNWDKYTSSAKTYFRTSAQLADAKKSDSPLTTHNLMCSDYKEDTWSHVIDGSGYDGNICIGWNNNAYIGIYDSRYVDVSTSDFKTAMNGVQLVYELATPLTIQLTPTPVISLDGVNNVRADSGDVLSGKYFAEL